MLDQLGTRGGGWTTGTAAWPSHSPSDSAGWWRSRRNDAAPSLAGALDAPASMRRDARLARLEAVLLVADTPLSPRRIAQYAALADATEARTLMHRLNAIYDLSRTAFHIERIAAGYRLMTRPEFALWLGKLHQRQAELKLSPPALETLTVIAYRQPITRAEVEALRGVQCAEILKQLMERGLVRIAGEDDSLGHPYLYETTRRFLELFGLKDLDELPSAARLRRPAAQPHAPATVAMPIDDEGESPPLRESA